MSARSGAAQPLKTFLSTSEKEEAIQFWKNDAVIVVTPIPALPIEALQKPDSDEWRRAYIDIASWCEYIDTLLAQQKCDALRLENTMKQLRGKARQHIKENAAPGLRLQDIDDHLVDSPEFADVMRLLQLSKQNKVVLEVHKENGDKLMRALTASADMFIAVLKSQAAKAENTPTPVMGPAAFPRQIPASAWDGLRK